MKFLIPFFTVFCINFAFGQQVILSEVKQVGKNTDKFLYKINPDSTVAEYLGQIEVRGFSADDVEIFNQIYKKAKSIGANAFSLKSLPTIDNSPAQFDPSHYFLNLYSVNKADFPEKPEDLYLISLSSKTQKISFDNELLKLESRTYAKRKILLGKIYTISSRKLLGSSVKVKNDGQQNGQYFGISSFQIKSNAYGSAGISIKSGDITKLEKSFGDFLITIYQKID